MADERLPVRSQAMRYPISGGELRQYADESPGSLPAIISVHEVVAAYWAAAEARDWNAVGALLADDVIYRGPQTREQVRRRRQDRLITDFWPDPYELPASGAHLVERY